MENKLAFRSLAGVLLLFPFVFVGYFFVVNGIG